MGLRGLAVIVLLMASWMAAFRSRAVEVTRLNAKKSGTNSGRFCFAEGS
jgi:hypothetical protein